VLRSDGRRQSPERLEDLKGFRTALYGCATRRADAWFELVDGLLPPSRRSVGQPIVAGWCYRLIVGLELARTSWTAPVDVHRLAPDDNLNLVAAGQIRGLLDRFPASWIVLPKLAV
jgi:hypothetical protein